MVGSYFDIFTDVSLDGGQTWAPALCPHPVALESSSSTIPTLSEWGLIIMALLLVTVASIFISRSHAPGLAVNGSLFVASVFIRVGTVAAFLWLAGIAIFGSIAGTISSTDVAGSLISTVIGAYWVHLLVAWPKAQPS